MEQAGEIKYFCSAQFFSLSYYFEDVKQRKNVQIIISSVSFFMHVLKLKLKIQCTHKILLPRKVT
jgi:hypothetical protein